MEADLIRRNRNILLKDSSTHVVSLALDVQTR